MGEHTEISWCDHTFNPWWGCTKVSPGCDHCYAEGVASRFGTEWGSGKTRRQFADKHWAEPLKWNARAGKAGKSARVFCASMADVFDKDAPEGLRERLWQLIKATPNLTWLVLTKRIGNAAKMLPQDWGDGYANVWLGATIVNQSEANRDVIKLLETKARIHFVSMEPLLGPVTLRHIPYYTTGMDGDDNRWTLFLDALSGFKATSNCGGTSIPKIDWVIAGGESGKGARPMHKDWARKLRDECLAAGVPYHFKQWGEYGPFVNEDHYTHSGEEKHAHAWVDSETADHGLCWIVDDDGLWSNWTGSPRKNSQSRIDDCVAIMGRHGKKANGFLLDGRAHQEFPGI